MVRARDDDEARICVFTPGGSIRAVVATALGLDPRRSRDRLSGSGYCAVTTLLVVEGEARGQGLRLLGYNADLGGLPPLPGPPPGRRPATIAVRKCLK